MPDRAIEVHGLADFRKELGNLQGKWPRELAKVHRTLGKEVAAEARKFARGSGPMQAHFAGSIYGSGTTRQASVAIRREANAAFWGAKKHTGWYANPRYANSPPQFPEWVGNNWDVGQLGQGPYAINPAIFHDRDLIARRFEEMVVDLARRAFPN